MNIYKLATYVNLDVDDSFSVDEVAQWFNKGISQYNLLPPMTTYLYVTIGDEVATVDNGLIDAYEDYPLDQTFMLGVMLPFINSAVRGQDSSVQEKQIYLQEFIENARTYKGSARIPDTYRQEMSQNLDVYQVGENVFISDMRLSPFQGDWSSETVYTEIVTETEEE